MTFAVVTFGCRVNQADSLSIGRALAGAGGVPAHPDTSAIIVVNTCAVTSAAEQDARQAIRRLHREHPDARIIVTGCYARREPAALKRLPGVSAIVEEAGATPAEWASAAGFEPGFDARGSGCVQGPGFLDRTMATLSVQGGCNGGCAFCIVPRTRGPARSMPLEQVLERLSAFEREGYSEVVISGVHLGAWGRDLVPASNLAKLLEAISSMPSRLRVRLSSLEPMDVTPEVEEVIAGSPRFARQLHLPIQHASDRVLRRMRRPYAFEHVARLLERLRARMPDASIGADLIAGFPGESDEDFELLESWLKRSPLSSVHVFPFSPRPGTPAASFVPRVPSAIVRQRVVSLRAGGAGLARRFNESQVGRTRHALTLGDGTVALTDNGLRVRIPPGRRRNERIELLITGANPLVGVVAAPRGLRNDGTD